jgi:hypothetical protein
LSGPWTCEDGVRVAVLVRVEHRDHGLTPGLDGERRKRGRLAGNENLLGCPAAQRLQFLAGRADGLLGCEDPLDLVGFNNPRAVPSGVQRAPP